MHSFLTHLFFIRFFFLNYTSFFTTSTFEFQELRSSLKRFLDICIIFLYFQLAKYDHVHLRSTQLSYLSRRNYLTLTSLLTDAVTTHTPIGTTSTNYIESFELNTAFAKFQTLVM